MTGKYSGIDPELRRFSRAGAFGVDGYVGNTPLIRLFRCKGSDDLFEAGIAAERAPERV
jgi:hypothetical protein